MPRLAAGLVLSTAVLGFVAAPAAAQPAGNLSIDGFRPAMDSRGYLTLNASQPLGHGELSFGLGALSWGHEMLAFENGGSTYSVDNVLTATLIAAVGLRVGPAELELGASMPLAIVEGERGPDALGDPNTPNDDVNFKLDGQGAGNLGLHVKTRFLKTTRGPRIGLGLIASLYLPTATADRFLGERAMTPQLIGVLDKEFGRRGQLRVALNGGIRVRSATSFTDTGDGGAPPTNMTVSAAAELPFGVGIAYAVAPQKVELVGEVFGALQLGDAENYQPLEAIGGIKLYLARNSFLSLGAGRGLAPSKGGNPDARAFIGIVFEPNIGDRDGDGIKDDVDRCPDSPEDYDGFDDGDGCPELDNDRDRIVDDDDNCPLVPEDRDGFADEDGCPEGDKNDRDGDRILDPEDACPDSPEDYDGFQDGDGCPDDDNDLDKILDVDDLCPDDPEDYDHFEDEDGCPDLDNDKDRILDKDDKCPLEPENYNGTEDEDGCKDRGITEIIDGGIVILKPIEFEFNSAKIRSSSNYILDAVVATMNGNPDIALIEVQGHTDERGDDEYNLNLSIRRAAAVLAYLTSHGVDSKRLTSEGYGETQPVIKQSSEKAWARNRRVEFVILKNTKID